MVQKVNITLDNVSPLITYSPSTAWHEGDSSDPYWQSYDHNGTFTLTTQFGASASITFNGTAVWIYGAKRPNHAPYNTTLDGRTVFAGGYSSVDEFQQVLFSGVGLSSGPHSVSIADSVVNAAEPYLDIDSIVYEVEVLDYDEEATQQDTADAFNFSPSAWSTNPEDLSNYSGGTGHSTSAPDAYVVYTFEGSSVEIYGAVGPENGAYTVQIDDGETVTFNGTKKNLIPQTLIYQSNNIVPGRHTVKISNSPFVGQTLSIDYAVIHTSPSTGSDGGGSSSSLSGGTIGGIAVGACAGVLLVLVGAFLWYRRRNRRPGLIHTKDPPDATNYGTSLVTFHTPSLPTTVERYPPLPVSASTEATMLQPTPAPTSIPSSSQSNSSVSNPDSTSRLILHNPNPSLTSSGTMGPVLDIGSASENARPYHNPTTRPLPQPASSNPHLRANASTLQPSLPGADLRTMRMQVEGRSQDFGPIAFILDPEHEGNTLPPDYHQATEPFPSPDRR